MILRLMFQVALLHAACVSVYPMTPTHLRVHYPGISSAGTILQDLPTLDVAQAMSVDWRISCTAYFAACEAVMAIMSSLPSSSASATAWM